MKIALTLIMEPADFIILLIWTLKGKPVRISKPKIKAEVERAVYLVICQSNINSVKV
jgi:hypothetical protein